jgi:hypothetical protein
MLKLMTGLPDEVVGVHAVGEVEDDDYESVLSPAIADRLTRHDEIRLLYVLGPEFTGFDADAMWEDAKLGARTFTSYERLAVVTDAPWVRRTVQAMGWLIPGEVRVFPDSALDEATSWIAT